MDDRQIARYIVSGRSVDVTFHVLLSFVAEGQHQNTALSLRSLRSRHNIAS